MAGREAAVNEGPRDLGRYLPLSARPRVDESAVSSDWGPRLAELVATIDTLIASLPSASLASREIRAARDRLSATIAAVPSTRRVRVPTLGAVLVEAFEFAALIEQRLAVDPVTSGAVALDRSLRAPLAIRAVLKNRTLHATDADWEFGTGPALSGTAAELVLFLYGRAGVPGS
jgi:hypothetical protein